jgi:hypothetical protein
VVELGRQRRSRCSQDTINLNCPGVSSHAFQLLQQVQRLPPSHNLSRLLTRITTYPNRRRHTAGSHPHQTSFFTSHYSRLYWTNESKEAKSSSPRVSATLMPCFPPPRSLRHPYPLFCFPSEEYTHTMPSLPAYCICILPFALESARFLSLFELVVFSSLYHMFHGFWMETCARGRNSREFVQLTLLLEERKKQNEGILLQSEKRSFLGTTLV